MTVPNLGYLKFLDLAAKLGCVGVEVRNDIFLPLFDDINPLYAGRIALDKGLRLVGLSQIYPFNDWTNQRENELKSLIEIAKASGAETINLIPDNSGALLKKYERKDKLVASLNSILALLEDADIVALVEPLGFERSSLRSKTELIDMINLIDGNDYLQIVHDTFHHTLAGGGPIYAKKTGIIHISGVTDPSLSFGKMEDEHRVLVDEKDRVGNIEQITALLAAGYCGPISFECFSPKIHALVDPYIEIKKSFDYIFSQLEVYAT